MLRQAFKVTCTFLHAVADVFCQIAGDGALLLGGDLGLLLSADQDVVAHDCADHDQHEAEEDETSHQAAMDALDLHSGFDVVVIPRSARGVRFLKSEVAPVNIVPLQRSACAAVAVPQSLSGAGLRQTRV
jgi:hypothetical protein